MAWRRKREEGPGEAQFDPARIAPPTSGTQDFTTTLQDAPRAETDDKREAERRLRKAEADLRRLERMESRSRRRQLQRERSYARKLARIQRSRMRTAGGLVALVLAIHGLASAMAILHLLWPDVGLWPPLLYEPSAHWEAAAIAFAAAAVGSVALVALAPSEDYQSRVRYALSIYLAVSMVTTVVGVLLAAVLEPIEGRDLPWATMVTVLLVLLACSGIPLPVLYWRAGRSFRLVLSDGYHLAMGVLTAILVAALILLPIAFLAWRGWMLEAGLAMMMAGALGIVFPAPALMASYVLEARPGAREAALVAAIVAALLLVAVYILFYLL